MHKIERGASFPQTLRLRNGLYVTLGSGGLLAVTHLDNYQKGDLRAFKGTVQIGALMHEGLPFMIVEYPDVLTLDAPVALRDLPASQKATFLAGANVMTLVATEGPSHLVRHIRTLGLSNELLNVFQKQDYKDRPEMQRAILSFQHQHPNVRIGLADVAQTFRRKRRF